MTLLEDKRFVGFLNKLIHDEQHDVTNMIMLIDMIMERPSTLDKESLLFMKVYFVGRLGLLKINLDEDTKTIAEVYYKLREQFDV